MHRIFPIITIATKPIRIRFQRKFLAKISIGAPTQTPNAYAEIKCPAVAMLICKFLATSGKIPIITNSATPNLIVPNANAIRLFFISLKIFSLAKLKYYRNIRFSLTVFLRSFFKNAELLFYENILSKNKCLQVNSRKNSFGTIISFFV